MKITTKKVIDVSDWDDEVNKIYGRPYSFQQQDGCQPRGNVYLLVPDLESDFDFDNDDVAEEVNGDEMGVSFEAWLARDPSKKLKGKSSKSDLECWWERNFYPNVQMIANDLHKRGLLEAGEYLINIDW